MRLRPGEVAELTRERRYPIAVSRGTFSMMGNCGFLAVLYRAVVCRGHPQCMWGIPNQWVSKRLPVVRGPSRGISTYQTLDDISGPSARSLSPAWPQLDRDGRDFPSCAGQGRAGRPVSRPYPDNLPVIFRGQLVRIARPHRRHAKSIWRVGTKGNLLCVRHESKRGRVQPTRGSGVSNAAAFFHYQSSQGFLGSATRAGERRISHDL